MQNKEIIKLRFRIKYACSKLVLVANCLSQLVFADSSIIGLSLILRDIEKELKFILNDLDKTVETESR
jgi:hypothetical protein